MNRRHKCWPISANKTRTNVSFLCSLSPITFCLFLLFCLRPSYFPCTFLFPCKPCTFSNTLWWAFCSLKAFQWKLKIIVSSKCIVDNKVFHTYNQFSATYSLITPPTVKNRKIIFIKTMHFRFHPNTIGCTCLKELMEYYSLYHWLATICFSEKTIRQTVWLNRWICFTNWQPICTWQIPISFFSWIKLIYSGR